MPDLAIKLTADTAEFQSDMGKASHIAEREMERMVARAAAAGELIGRALSNVASGFARMIGETLKAGDEISKLAQRTGFAVERLSELKFAAQLSDVGFGQLSTSLGFFNKALAEAQNEGTKTGQLFRALGVDLSAGPQRAFEQFAKAIASLDPETKVAAMRIAFGRAGDALIPFIAQMDEATEKARRLGIVMSDQLAKDSERFNDAVTALKASSQALAITALNPAAAALATIAENLVKAKERGTSFRDTAIEIGKVFLAAHGQILSYVPLWGTALENAAQRAFNALEKMRQAVPVIAEGQTVGGTRPIGGSASMGPPDPADKQARVACAVSGGKWENGACVYKRERTGTGRTPRNPTLSDEQVARLQSAADEQEAKTIADAWSFVPEMTARLERWDRLVNAWGEDTFLGMSLEEAEAWVKLQYQGIDALDGIEDATSRVAAGFTEDGKAISQASAKTNDWAKSLGLTFSSAFENAATKGMKLRDVVQGLGQDIARILLRKTVTEPLANSLGNLLSSSGILNFLGGGSYANPNASAGGRYLQPGSSNATWVGEEGPELFVPNTAGTIVPNHAMGGGGVVVQNTYHIDSRTDRAEIIAFVEQRSRQTEVNIFDRVRRGSADRRTMRG